MEATPVVKAAAGRSWRSRSLAPMLVGLILISLAMLALVSDLRLHHLRALTPLFRSFQHNPLAAAILLYAEESGVPLPAPGDVFVIYAGITSPRSPLAWVLVGLMLVVSVVAGASNLFFISRRYGRRLAQGRVGVALHMTPERLAQAEGWFQRWGPLALIFGRHVPGLRIPITVAAAVFNVPWRIFAASVALSSAIWVSIFLTLGVVYGRAAVHLLDGHKSLYVVLPGIIAVFWIGFIGYRLWSHSARMRRETPRQP